MRALGLICLIGACNPSGLTLEVVISDPAIKRVEVMAGDSCHPDCPRATVPPGLPPMTVDDAFVVVDPEKFTVSEKDFTDGVAGFRIESPTDTTLPILVVLGYDASEQIGWSWSKHSVAIPDADSERWRIELDPTTQILPLMVAPPPGTERHAMWPDPGGHTSCLVLEHWGANAVPSREMLGPKTNTDCDVFMPPNECAPWIPNATGVAPTIADANCVLQKVISPTSGAYACQLGGPQCTEIPVGPREQCVTVDEPYCVPETLCTQCAAAPDQQMCLRMAIAMGTTNTTTLPFLKCVIHTDVNGNRCDSTQLKIDASALLVTTSHKCVALRLSDGGTPFDPFTDRLHVGNAKLRLDSFAQPCNADASWENGMAPLENFGLFEVDVDNGYHLVVPIKVEVQPGCDAVGAVSVCQFVRPSAAMNETIYNCLAATPTGFACEGDANAGCVGPMCNGNCCGAGEQCTPNGCSCGGGPGCSNGDHCAVSNPDGGTTCGSICCGKTTLCPFP